MILHLELQGNHKEAIDALSRAFHESLQAREDMETRYMEEQNERVQAGAELSSLRGGKQVSEGHESSTREKGGITHREVVDRDYSNTRKKAKVRM